MNVCEYYDLPRTNGEIGIEIELEGSNVDEAGAPGWRVERDGSLRGDSAEYVMRKPVMLREVHKYVRALQKSLDDADAEPVDTGRAGVHVHVNMQQYSMTQVINYICAYMIFEDCLTDFCGEHRVGNLFCLRVRDADRLIFSLRDRIRRKDLLNINNNANRYAAINIESLPKFGSLEFRAMRSTVDPMEISQWAGMLVCIRDWAVKFDDPRDIIQEFSVDGPLQVFEDVFQQYEELLEFDPDSMYEGMRNAQFLAFCEDNWEFDPVILLREETEKGGAKGHIKEMIQAVLNGEEPHSTAYVLHLYRELLNFREYEEEEREDLDDDFDEPEDEDDEPEELLAVDDEDVRALVQQMKANVRGAA